MSILNVLAEILVLGKEQGCHYTSTAREPSIFVAYEDRSAEVPVPPDRSIGNSEYMKRLKRIYRVREGGTKDPHPRYWARSV
jgi:hypothetical protein